MDLQQEWNKLQKENLAEPPISELEIIRALNQQSRAPVAGVRRVIRFRMYAVLVYLMLAIAFLGYNWQDKVKLPIAMIIVVYYFLALVASFWQIWYLQQKAVTMDGDLSHTLHAYYRLIKNNIQLDTILGWFVYPMSFALGFFYTLIRPDRGILDVMQNRGFMLPLLLGMVLITPLFWWLNKLVNRRVFGNLLEQLEENIHNLENN